MNRERRKEVARVFFDLSKYVLTVAVVGSILTKNYDFKSLIIGGIIEFFGK